MSVRTRDAAREYEKVAERAWARGLVCGTGGNMSIRLPDGDVVLVKPTGVANIECTYDRLLEVRLDGAVMSSPDRPTKDVNVHLAIYAARDDVGGVVHAHGVWATTLTFLVQGELPLITPHAADKLGRVPIVAGHASATDELTSVISGTFSEGVQAVLIAGHGIVAVGPTLTAAEEVAELVEETAQIALLVRFGSVFTGGIRP